MAKKTVNKAREKARENYQKRMQKSREKADSSGNFDKSTRIFKTDLEDVKFWDVKEGKHWFDIIPYAAGKYDPDCEEGEETYVFQPYIHRNVGPSKSDVICLQKTYGKSCYLCEKVKEQLDDNVDWNDIDFKVQRNPRAIYNVIVRDDVKQENIGVQVFHASYWTMERFLLGQAEEVTLSDEGEVTSYTYFFDQDEGKTIYFRRVGLQLSTEFLDIKFQNRKSPVTKEDLEGAYVLDELVFIPTYEQQKEIFTADEGEEVDTDVDEEIEEEEEEEEETALEDVLKTKDRKELIRYIKEKGLEFKVKKDMKLKEIVKGILEEVEGSEEEEEEEETALEDVLKTKDRKGFIRYIKENDLEFKVKKDMKLKEIVKGILEEIKGSEEEEEETANGKECPGGGTFGKDWDSLDGCEDCSIWDDCMEEQEKGNS